MTYHTRIPAPQTIITANIPLAPKPDPQMKWAEMAQREGHRPKLPQNNWLKPTETKEQRIAYLVEALTEGPLTRMEIAAKIGKHHTTTHDWLKIARAADVVEVARHSAPGRECTYQVKRATEGQG